MSHLTFDEANHAYALYGLRIPSVTQVLSFGQDLSRIPAWTAQRGTAFHLATEYDDAGDLDESSIDPLVKPHLDAYRKWKAATKPQFLATEVRLWGEIDGLRFAGTIDRAYEAARCRVGILDLKSGQPRKEHGAQLAAYGVAYQQRFACFDPTCELKGVYCLKDGTFAERPYDDPQHLETFRTALKRWWDAQRGEAA